MKEEILKDLVAEEALSDTEVSIVALLLEGKTLTEIKTLLSLKSENAVQKRLSQIYAKFRLTGAGPGKLDKLQKILKSRFQALHSKKKVAIFWSGPSGQERAQILRDTIFKHPQIEAFIFDTDMNVDSTQFVEKFRKDLKDTELGVVCLTKEIFEIPRNIYAIGFLTGHFKNLSLINFTDAPIFYSITNLPLFDGTKEEDLAILLNMIIVIDIKEAKEWVNFKFNNSNLDKLSKEAVEGLTYLNHIKNEDKSAEDILQEISITKTLPINNTILRAVVKQHFEQNFKIFEYQDYQVSKVQKNGNSYHLPAEEYPYFLISLQKNETIGDIYVRAVAVVDNPEKFWFSQEGYDILETTNQNSQRVFVFSNRENFLRSAEIIRRHGSKYNVYAISKGEYDKVFKETDAGKHIIQAGFEDFSIIESKDNQVVAYYERNPNNNPKAYKQQKESGDMVIHFKAIYDKKEKNQWADCMDKIINQAIKVELNENMKLLESNKKIYDIENNLFSTENEHNKSNISNQAI